MKVLPHECVEDTRDPIIVVEEKGRKAIFRNDERARFLKVHVDGCLIAASETKRSDYIVTKVGTGSALIELKGKDLNTAYKQLLSTLGDTDCHCWLEQRKVLLIVCSRVPAFTTTDARFIEDCRKRGVRSKVLCDQREVRIEDLLGITPTLDKEDNQATQSSPIFQKKRKKRKSRSKPS